MQFDNELIRSSLRAFDFKSLFNELGWDHHSASHQIPSDDETFTLSAVAHKRGVQIFECAAGSDGKIPEYATRRKIDKQVSKLAHEHLTIFVNKAKSDQIWQWVSKEPGQAARYHEQRYHVGQSGEALLQKLEYLTFPLNAEESLTISGVTIRLRDAFQRERVTRRFYDRFKDEHAAFLKFLDGIPDKEMERWYVSVMINRVMFIYFVQKKGFLDWDRDYLKHKLAESKKRGKDLFYKQFLCPLFFEGFAKKESERSATSNKLLGDVPYFNGGLFLKHQIEELHGMQIQIADGAFEKLFEFFDQYQWHLDERPLRDDREINPDVLGYIFEKYINQKQMGAYYSKEDITGYISKNSVIPYLFEVARKNCKIAFEGEASVWRLLQADPDRYLYKAVRHGISWDIHSNKLLDAPLSLPPDIEQGIDTTNPNLIERRKGWNRPAPPEYALPTESWREVVARRQRYQEVRSKLAAGEVQEVNDLVTYNLDIIQFAQDVIENYEGADLIRAFWRAIVGRIPQPGTNETFQQGISILDPACGSGAFLFAALNILEPLYEACLVRMEAFLGDLERSGEKHHPEKFADFRRVLERVSQHPNRRYFILKSMIVNNLFGVDIMEEAVEICKLRLFLKLVAQVERTDQIEPLPDIDFNIRAGNTLVGYATYEDVKKAAGRKFAFDDAMTRIEQKAQDVDNLIALFRQQQTNVGGEVTPNDKQKLRERLKVLEDELNANLSGEYGIKTKATSDYGSWLISHKPFHWFVEFHRIMTNGGFDVIIGNPPYTEVPKNLNRSLLRNTFKSALEKWSRDEDLYTFFAERSFHLLQDPAGQFGMILPLSVSFSTKAPFVVLRKVLREEKGLWHWSHFDRIPSALFGNEVRTRCTIALLSRSSQAQPKGATTSLLRWNAEYRDSLFQTMNFAELDMDISVGIPKVSSHIQADVLKSLLQAKTPLGLDLTRSIPFERLVEVAPDFPQPCVYIGGTAYNWFPCWRDIPTTTNLRGKASLPARTAGFKFADEESANLVFALLCSSLGYWWWAVASDGFNLKKWLLNRFPVSIKTVPRSKRKQLAALGASLRGQLARNYVYKDNKGRIGNFYLPACREEIAAIDGFLASAVNSLSSEFFEDISNFNATFSRAADVDQANDAEE